MVLCNTQDDGQLGITCMPNALNKPPHFSGGLIFC